MIKIFKGSEEVDECSAKLVDLLNPQNYQVVYTRFFRSVKVRFSEYNNGEVSFFNE